MNISVFFPVYNEEGNIPKLAVDATKVLERVAKNYEIMFVLYEGSTDKSRELIENLHKKDKRIRLVLQPKDMKGVGQAYKMGYESAKYDIIFYADGDNQFDLNEINKLLPHLKNADIIAGYRLHRKDPFVRKFTSKVYNLILRFLFGKTVRDVDCAFRMVKKSVFQKIKLRSATGVGTAELLVRAKKAGLKIVEVPVTHLPRYAGRSVFESGFNLPKISTVVSVLGEVLRMRREINKNDARK